MALFLASFASALVAQVDSQSVRHYFRPNTLGLGSSVSSEETPSAKSGSNLIYHTGGEVIVSDRWRDELHHHHH